MPEVPEPAKEAAKGIEDNLIGLAMFALLYPFVHSLIGPTGAALSKRLNRALGRKAR